MPFRISKFAVHILLLAAFLLSFAVPSSAQGDDVAQLLARINTLRTQNGLLPLDLNSALTSAAQSHSNDMAVTGNVDHLGSDGSTIDSRIRAAGYGHWRDFGVWGENIYGGQMADVDTAWNFWINSAVHRANLLKPRYREVGIGVGHSDKGTYYTLTFGAQPNVLPFFVTGSAPLVTLLLTNEDDITTGEGVAVMGQATNVRIAEGADTSGAGWQPWAPSIPFQLSDKPGLHTITVEYRDDLKRGSKFSRTINTSDLNAATPTASPTTTPTKAATRAMTPTPKATATSLSAPTGTSAPNPTATLQQTIAPTPLATGTPQPTATATPQPTVTATNVQPAVTFTPIASPTATSQLIAANLPTMPAGSRLTPPAPRPAPTERPLFTSLSAAPNNLFAVLIGLQAVVLVIAGAVVVVRARRRS